MSAQPSNNKAASTSSGQEQHNRRVQICGSLFSKLGDALSNTKVVLPALFHAIAAPTFFVGLISPIRESFSMLPQVFLTERVNRQKKPQTIYAFGALAQALSLAAMLVAFLNLEGWIGGLAILIALLLFSLARSLCSLSSKTVLGATVRKSKRGGLLGTAGTIAGAISVAYGICLYIYTNRLLNTEPSSASAASTNQSVDSGAVVSQGLAEHHWILGSLLGAASLFFALAAVSYLSVQWQNKSPDSSSGSTPDQSPPAWRLLMNDTHFARFVITRAFMMVSALAMPYIAMLSLSSSQQDSTSTIAVFALLVIIEGSSSLVSSRFWGTASDKNSRMVLISSALLSCVLCAFATAGLSDVLSPPTWAWLLMYALLSLTHNGVRLGRKTFVVDLADDQQNSNEKRTEYVAISNTCIGALLLLFGLASAVLAQSSLFALFIVFTISALIATVLGLTLKRI